MKRWFEMRAAQNGGAEVLIYDRIGAAFFEEGLTAKDFDRELKALGDVSEITVRINSPGGSVFDGLAIFNQLKAHPARIVARVDGLAASAASLIAMAADEIVIPENAFLLIHEPRAIAMGTAGDMLAMAADLERMTDQFVKVYADRSGSPEADIRAIMAEDRLMNAEEALRLGLADTSTAAVKMAADYDLALLPEAARDAIAAATADAGDPPPADPQADPEPPADPAADPAPEPGPTATVIDLNEARAASRKDALGYAQEVIDLCSLAGKSPQFAADLIKDEKPIAEVRAALLADRAKADAGTTVGHHHPVPVGTAAASWAKAIENTNARVR